MRIRSLGILIFLLLSGCVLAPTQISSSEEPRYVESFEEKILKDFKPEVFLDTRDFFSSQVNPIPGAALTPWSFFIEPKKNQADLDILQKDLEGLARRLALVGVSPEKNILVIGDFSKSNELANAGAVASILKLLGVQKIKTIHYEMIKNRRQLFGQKTELRNAPFWKPQVNESILQLINNKKAALETELCVQIDSSVPTKPSKTNPKKSSQILKNCNEIIHLEMEDLYLSNGFVNLATINGFQNKKIEIFKNNLKQDLAVHWALLFNFEAFSLEP